MTEKLLNDANNIEAPTCQSDTCGSCEMVKENIKKIRETVSNALKENGSDTEVTLMAATKTVSPDMINYAIHECGLTDIGENRVQELLSKYESIDKENVRLHFIGSLQPNKVKYIIDKVCLIHSLDGISLAKEISKRASKCGKTMDVLIEVNIGEEENKGGILPSDVRSFADEIKDMPCISVVGLMTMAPKCESKEQYRDYFKKVRKLFDEMKAEGYFASDKPILSMGMSDSYEMAVECGSTLIRPGSAIFGKRVAK